MVNKTYRIVIIGLSLSSSWGNGHATTFRALIRSLKQQGHSVLFLERDVPWYASNRDLPDPDYCELALYRSVEELKEHWAHTVRTADMVIAGSYVPDGVTVCQWVLQTAGGATAFYDIDTPVTLAKLRRGDFEYLDPTVIPGFDYYLSFSAGKALEILGDQYGAKEAVAFHCSVDIDSYFPHAQPQQWDLGYLGTYSDDRQPPLDKLMLQAAENWKEGRFVVAGPQYPQSIHWAANVERIDHLPPRQHRDFYNQQRFTLNITRRDMVDLGHSPSVRLFEAAACGTPIISDYWVGLEDYFVPGEEILVSHSPEETLQYLREYPEEERKSLAAKALEKVRAAHTSAHRAEQLTGLLAGRRLAAESARL